MTIDSDAAESVWPISLLKEIPTLKIVSKKKWFVAANGQDMGRYGRRGVKFGDEGDAKILSFEVTDVTKPPVAVRRIIEKGNEVHFRAENFVGNAKGRKKGGPT